MRLVSRPLVAILAGSTLALGACGSTDTSGAGDGAEDGFPVTVTHALGETVIDSKPERVVAVGSAANAEVALALDIVPVAMPRTDYGDEDGDGVLPWVTERLDDIDADTPILFDETEGIDFESVSETEPDVILAATSGLTPEDYETLSKIAPVVAYPDLPWTASWRETITMNSEALGKAEEGQELIADLTERIESSAAEYPELNGVSAAFINISVDDPSTVLVAASADARASYLADIGLTTPTVVEQNSKDAEAFRFSISAEEIDAFDDTDIVLGYSGEGTSLLDTLRSNPLLSRMSAAERGSVAEIVDGSPLAAAVSPSALGIPWSIDELLDRLATAARQLP